jgi:plasmid stabilization system protein ParE
LKVRLTAAAIGDIQQARDWYAKRSPGMGATFVSRVDEAIQSIAANAEVYQKIHRGVRERAVFPTASTIG